MGPDLEGASTTTRWRPRRAQSRDISRAARPSALALIKQALDASSANSLDRAARSRARPAAPGRLHARLCRRRARLHGEARAELHRPTCAMTTPRTTRPRLRRRHVGRRQGERRARHGDLEASPRARAGWHDRSQRSMVNGHGICHGGYIFTLADSAFAFACNTYNQRTVAQHCAITFLRPAGKAACACGASARERQRAGRTGIYDVTVPTDGDGHRRVPRPLAHDRRRVLSRRMSKHRGNAMLDLSPQKERTRADRNRLARRDRRAATARLKWSLRHAYDNVPHYREKFDGGRRASRRSARRSPTSRSFPSPPSRTCATTIPSACSPCRATRSRASTPPPAPPASRRSSATRRATSTSGRASWRARSAPPAAGPA